MVAGAWLNVSCGPRGGCGTAPFLLVCLFLLTFWIVHWKSTVKINVNLVLCWPSTCLPSFSPHTSTPGSIVVLKFGILDDSGATMKANQIPPPIASQPALKLWSPCAGAGQAPVDTPKATAAHHISSCVPCLLCPHLMLIKMVSTDLKKKKKSVWEWPNDGWALWLCYRGKSRCHPAAATTDAAGGYKHQPHPTPKNTSTLSFLLTDDLVEPLEHVTKVLGET